MIERQSSEASKAIKIQTPVGSRERERETREVYGCLS